MLNEDRKIQKSRKNIGKYLLNYGKRYNFMSIKINGKIRKKMFNIFYGFIKIIKYKKFRFVIRLYKLFLSIYCINMLIMCQVIKRVLIKFEEWILYFVFIV